MADDIKKDEGGDREKSIPFISPSAPRKKRIVELLNAFLEDKASLAELKGISKEKLYLLAEAGYVKLKHGRIDEAERIYQALILLDHRNAYYHSVMGSIHQKKNRPVEAILEYTRATQIDKNEISCYVNRGEIYLRHRNYRKAAEDFRQAIVLDESGQNMWANRSRSLVIALKRSLEAEKSKKRLKRPARPKSKTPQDAAAKEAGSVPKSGTPTPPTPEKAVPKKRPAKKRSPKKKS